MLFGSIMSYFGIDRKVILRRIALLSAIMLTYWILLFTDPYHHLIRKDVWLEPFGPFERIGMSRTPLGFVFYSMVHIIGLWTCGLIVNHYRKVFGTQRTQCILLIFVTMLPFVLPPLAGAVGLQMNMSVAMVPSALLLLYVLLLHKFLQVRPLAKEKVLEHMAEAIMIANEQDVIIDANPAARTIRRLIGTDKLVGKPVAALFAPYPDLQAFYKRGQQGKTEAEIGGSHFEVRFIPIQVRGDRTGALLIFHDITERKKYENELILRATTDGLTKLYNRTHFFSLLDQARKDCAAAGSPISFMLIDLDDFKKINDQYGHVAGDRVLKHFAAQLTDVVREVGVAGRVGGEEFAAFLPEMDGKAAYEVAENLRRRVQREKLRLSASDATASEIRYSISIGVAELPDARMSVESWYTLADTCLYTSKKNGRNQTTLAQAKPSA
jgi:diguanylate cyclase (GGDEF)-like protein/PAS domain S-box-containing protein